MFDGKAFGAEILEVVTEYMAAANAPLLARIAELEAREPIPPEPYTPEPGLIEDLVAAEVQRAVDALPPVEPGHSVTVEEVRPLIEAFLEENTKTFVEVVETLPLAIEQEVTKAVALIPLPQDGQSVEPDTVAEMVRQEVAFATASIPPAPPGKDADPAFVAILVADEVQAAVAAIPRPQDGKSIEPDEIAEIIRSEVEKAVSAIPPPKDGAGVVDALIRQDGALALVLSNGQVRELAGVPLPVADQFSEICPDDTAELVAGVIKLMAELPDIVLPPALATNERSVSVPAKQLPITLHINGGGVAPPAVPTRKRVTTGRDAVGNLVADIVEITEQPLD